MAAARRRKSNAVVAPPPEATRLVKAKRPRTLKPVVAEVSDVVAIVKDTSTGRFHAGVWQHTPRLDGDNASFLYLTCKMFHTEGAADFDGAVAHARTIPKGRLFDERNFWLNTEKVIAHHIRTQGPPNQLRVARDVPITATKSVLDTDQDLAAACERLRDSDVSMVDLGLTDYEFRFVCDAPLVLDQWGAFTWRQRAKLRETLKKLGVV